MFFVVHVVYGVISEVFYDQTMLFVIHVDYVIFPQVYHDQTMVFVVHMDCGVFSDIFMFITKWDILSSTWTKSLPASTYVTTRFIS